MIRAIFCPLRLSKCKVILICKYQLNSTSSASFISVATIIILATISHFSAIMSKNQDFVESFNKYLIRATVHTKTIFHENLYLYIILLSCKYFYQTWLKINWKWQFVLKRLIYDMTSLWCHKWGYLYKTLLFNYLDTLYINIWSTFLQILNLGGICSAFILPSPLCMGIFCKIDKQLNMSKQNPE